MASQITHIPYGRKVKDLFLQGKEIDERKFYVGTVFPDIRYLGDIDRKKTHWENPQIGELDKIENDFELGMYVHSLVDIERNRVLKRLDIKGLIPQEPMVFQVLKIIEDMVVYPLIEDWDEIISYFDQVLAEELEYVSKEEAFAWHQKLEKYFSQPPSIKSVSDFLNHLVLTEQQKEEATRLFKKLKKDDEVKRVLGQVYKELFEVSEKRQKVD